MALAHAPVAVMLSFGDPRPFAPAIKEAGRLLICQVQDMQHAEAAIDVGADMIVAQGTEAGGHGARRATLTLVPEVADLLARRSPDTLLVAAGGIADGRGLAAALMLGADGCGRLAALGQPRGAGPFRPATRRRLPRTAMARGPVGRAKSPAASLARRVQRPVLRNSFTDRWAGKEDELRVVAESLRPAYLQSIADADADKIAVYVGEAIGLMHSLVPAGDSILEMVAQARGRTQKRCCASAALNGSHSPAAGYRPQKPGTARACSNNRQLIRYDHSPRFTSGATNCGSGPRKQDPGVLGYLGNLTSSTATRPAGLA